TWRCGSELDAPSSAARARPEGRGQPLRHLTLQPELAGVPEHGGAVFVGVLVQDDPIGFAAAWDRLSESAKAREAAPWWRCRWSKAVACAGPRWRDALATRRSASIHVLVPTLPSVAPP